MGRSGRGFLLVPAVFSWLFGRKRTEQSSTADEETDEDSFQECIEEFQADENHQPSASPPQAYTDKAIIIDVSHVSVGGTLSSVLTLRSIAGIFKKGIKEGFRHFVLVGDGIDNGKPYDHTPKRPSDLYRVLHKMFNDPKRRLLKKVLPDLADKPECLVFEQAVGSADTVVTDWAWFLSDGGKRLVLVFGDDSDLAGHLCTAPRGVFVRSARGPWQAKMWETALVGDVHQIPKTPLGRQQMMLITSMMAGDYGNAVRGWGFVKAHDFVMKHGVSTPKELVTHPHFKKFLKDVEVPILDLAFCRYTAVAVQVSSERMDASQRQAASGVDYKMRTPVNVINKLPHLGLVKNVADVTPSMMKDLRGFLATCAGRTDAAADAAHAAMWVKGTEALDELPKGQQLKKVIQGGHSFQHPYEEYASSGVAVLIEQAEFQAILAKSEMPEESWQRRHEMVSDILVPSMRQAIADGACFSLYYKSEDALSFWEAVVTHKQAALTYMAVSHPAHVLATTAKGAAEWDRTHLYQSAIQDFLEELGGEVTSPQQDRIDMIADILVPSMRQAIADGASFSLTYTPVYVSDSEGGRSFWEAVVTHKQAALTYMATSHPAHMYVTTAHSAANWVSRNLNQCAQIQEFLEEIGWAGKHDKTAARSAAWATALQQHKDRHLPDSDAMARAYSASAIASTGDTVRLPTNAVIAAIQSEAAAAVAAGTGTAWQQEFNGMTVQQLRAFVHRRVSKFWKPHECELCAFLSSMQDQFGSTAHSRGKSVQRIQQLLHHMQQFKERHPGKPLLCDPSKQPEQPEQPKQPHWNALSADMQDYLSIQDVLANHPTRTPCALFGDVIRACQLAADRNPGCQQADYLSQVKDFLYPGRVPAAATAAAADTSGLVTAADAATDLSGSRRGTGAAPAVGGKRRCRHAAQVALSSSSSEDDASSDDDWETPSKRLKGSRPRPSHAPANSRRRSRRVPPTAAPKLPTAVQRAKARSTRAGKGAAAAAPTKKRGAQSSDASAATRSSKQAK